VQAMLPEGFPFHQFNISTSVSLLCLWSLEKNGQDNGQDRSHDTKCQISYTDTCLLLFLGCFAYKNSTRISSVSDSTCAMLTNDQILSLTAIKDLRRLIAFECVLYLNCKNDQKSRCVCVRVGRVRVRILF